MGTVTVYAPVRDFEGDVAGVAFEKGVATFDPATNPAAMQYFRGAGYGIDAEPERERPESPDPRQVGTDGDGVEVAGTRLRDAAVDPKPRDFLAPTNAGEANPHGPDVVAPGVHAIETGIITPGPVSNDPNRQDQLEKAVASVSLAEGRDVGEVTAAAAEANPTPPGTTDGAEALAVDEDLEVVQPKGNASHELWVEYAVAQGAPRDEVEPLTRDEIRDRYQA